LVRPAAPAAGWLAALAILLGASLGASSARAFDQRDRWERPGGPTSLERREAARSPVGIQLPLALQMRFRTSRVWGFVAPDAIDERRVRSLQSSLIFDHSLNALHPRDLAVEGHLQITRRLGQGFELGMAWSSRSAFSSGVGIELDRHFIGCVLRLVR
jgi:hypothetical protein